MDYDWIDRHSNKYAQTLNGKIFTGVSCNTESIRRTNRSECGMVITLVVSGYGSLVAGEKTYAIKPGSVMFRHPRMDYRFVLSSQCFHRRCYLVLPNEIFSLLSEIHPNLVNVPPVFTVEDIRRFFDDFLLVYESVEMATDENFFSLLPVVERYMLHVLSSYLMEGKSAQLRRAKAQLEMDFTSSLEDIAREYSMSYNTFRKNFAQAYKIAPQRYRLKCKVEKAKQLLSMGYQCSEVADMLSYPDLYTFSHQFKALVGETPREYRKVHIL